MVIAALLKRCGKGEKIIEVYVICYIFCLRQSVHYISIFQLRRREGLETLHQSAEKRTLTKNNLLQNFSKIGVILICLLSFFG